jgi:hypothetical protein
MYRERFPLQIQMPNQKPPTCKVMVTSFDRFSVGARTDANGCSILRIPANYMAQAAQVTGSWVAQSGADYLKPVGFERYVDMYRHYHVLGSWIEVTAVNGSNIGASSQFHNFLALARTDTTGQFSTSTPAISLEQAYGVKTARWGGVSAGSSKGASLKMGYNPHKQFGVKDTTDNANLRTATSADLSAGPNEKTFFEVALKGLLDITSEGHPDAIVDVKVKYILQYSEPIADAEPENSNQPTIL